MKSTILRLYHKKTSWYYTKDLIFTNLRILSPSPSKISATQFRSKKKQRDLSSRRLRKLNISLRMCQVCLKLERCLPFLVPLELVRHHFWILLPVGYLINLRESYAQITNNTPMILLVILRTMSCSRICSCRHWL